MKRLASLCVVLSAHLAAASAAHAAGRLAEVAIVDRDLGTRLEAHYYHGEYWVAGQPGARYSIHVRNRLGARVLAVTSVDGVNVLSGQTASWDQGGYVLDPGEQYEITGWRKSDYQVADFAFTAAPRSYAARTGRPDNVGVIGIALFRERPIAYVLPPRLPEIAGSARSETQRAQDGSGRPARLAANEASAPLASATAPMAPASEARASADLSEKSMAAASPAPSLGTAHGEREYSYVAHTSFVRNRSTPDEIIRIRYDSTENLIAMGIIRPDHHGAGSPPNPFPDASDRQYVPDPPPDLLR
jgi:hypothetical protein